MKSNFRENEELIQCLFKQLMSFWSETRKRRQSKFSTSMSLTETNDPHVILKIFKVFPYIIEYNIVKWEILYF